MNHTNVPEGQSEIDKLRTLLQQAESNAAVMRTVVEMWQEIGPDEESQQYVDAALATNAGKPLLELLKDAEGLLRETEKVEDQFFTVNFLNRRKSFLELIKS